MTIAINDLSFYIGGQLILLIFIISGAYTGWERGYRFFLTLTLGTSLAYLLFISGSEQLLGFINRFYTNWPKLAAILIGGDIDNAGTLPPLTAGEPLPDIARFFFFLATTGLSWMLNQKPKWFSKDAKEQFAREIGAFNGGLTALLLCSAITTFWPLLIPEGNALATSLKTLPDVRTIAPSFIGVFFAVITLGLVLNLPKTWKP
jgi:hypothetical protein